jgi:hypothetical protein
MIVKIIGAWYKGQKQKRSRGGGEGSPIQELCFVTPRFDESASKKGKKW